MQSLCEIWHDFHFQGQIVQIKVLAMLKISRLWNKFLIWKCGGSFRRAFCFQFLGFCVVSEQLWYITKYHFLMTRQFPLSLKCLQTRYYTAHIFCNVLKSKTCCIFGSIYFVFADFEAPICTVIFFVNFAIVFFNWDCSIVNVESKFIPISFSKWQNLQIL